MQSPDINYMAKYLKKINTYILYDCVSCNISRQQYFYCAQLTHVQMPKRKQSRQPENSLTKAQLTFKSCNHPLAIDPSHERQQIKCERSCHIQLRPVSKLSIYSCYSFKCLVLYTSRSSDGPRHSKW